MASKPLCNLLTQLLNLPEVKVSDYQLHQNIGIILYLESKSQQVPCPRCHNISNRLHQNHWYLVKDLPVSGWATYLKVNRRQFKCETCKKPFSEVLDYVEKNRTYTKRLTTRIVEEVLDSNIQSVAKRNGLSEEEIQTILKDAALQFLKDKPKPFRRLGIDEISLVKGQGNYCAVLVDIDTGKLLAIVESRCIESLRKVLQSWGDEILSQIEEVSMDLWKPYKSLVQELMPNAEIVPDRFHIMKQVTDELDAQRKVEKKEAESLKDRAEKERRLSAIKKSKYALLKNKKDLNPQQEQKLIEVKKVLPKLANMHRLKEEFREIFETSPNPGTGLLKLLDWLKDAARDCPKSSQTIVRWFGEIINYFEHRTTNGVGEGINNKLKLIKRAAYGFRNFENFKLRSLLNWHFNI